MKFIEFKQYKTTVILIRTVSNNSKMVRLGNSVQIQDNQMGNLEQQSQQASLPTSLRKQINHSSQIQRKNNFKKQQSNFFNDLIKMIQISLIVVLLIFVFLLGYAIVYQVKQFWFESQAQPVSILNDQNDLRRNDPIIKMQLKPHDTQKTKEISQKTQQQESLSNVDNVVDQQKQLEFNQHDQNKENKQIINVQTQSNKDFSSQKNLIQENTQLKQPSDLNAQQQMKTSTIQSQSKNGKQQQNNLINQNQNKNQNLNQQLSTKIPQPQLSTQTQTQAQTEHVSESNSLTKPKPPTKADKKKPVSQIGPHTVLPSDGKQIYDPVLIQLQKMRKRSGKNFKQTIYTIRNTQISEQQYKLSKQLIQITQFYNHKKRKFNVRNNTINDYKCGPQDPECQNKQRHIDEIVSEQKKYYLQRYRQPWRQITQQLPFCIIVPSYKNNQKNRIYKNLNSIFQQQYSNYHVIYIDDNSKDGTTAKVKDYRTINNIQQTQLTLLVNKQNKKALSNIYKAAHYYCKRKQIMLIVDGDDYLIGTQVLKLLNFQYQTKKLLAAYTNYLRINQPYYVKIGTSTPYPKPILDKRAFRKNFSIFRASHLRSFYVDLFRKIKQQDLQDSQGNFFTAANDFAIMMPILQMSAPHVEYIPQLTYLYDSGTGLNNFQSKQGVQSNNAKIIAKRSLYPQITKKEFYELTLLN